MTGRPLDERPLEELVEKWRVRVKALPPTASVKRGAINTCINELEAALLAAGAADRGVRQPQELQNLQGEIAKLANEAEIGGGYWTAIKDVLHLFAQAAPLALPVSAPQQTENKDDLSRVETGATIPSTRSTAQSADGDT